MSVGWVAVAATAAGTVISANKASGAQKNATAAAKDVAEQELELSRETLDFYKQQYADQKPLQERAANTAFEVADAQLASQRLNDSISQDYWNYQKGTFRPLEMGLVADAQGYNTEARREQKAGEAMADAQQQIDAAQAQQQRGMARMGVNPSDPKFLAMSNQMTMAGALGKAQAANKAREGVELQGWARQMDAANLGRGLASSQATSAGVALRAGNNAVGNAGTPLTQAQGATKTLGQGYQMSMQGMNNASNTFGQIAGQQDGGAGIWAGMGNLTGQFLGSKAGSEWMASKLK